MTTSQNGWRVLSSLETRKWIIPGTGRHLVLNPSHAGFVLAHLALWYHEKVERLDLGVWDEWGWAVRDIRGSSVVSNHASGTACDLNSTRHPMGVPVSQTFTTAQLATIRKRMRWVYRVVRWGGDYQNRPDGMHFEIWDNADAVRRAAALLARTPRGKRVLAANPGYSRG